MSDAQSDVRRIERERQWAAERDVHRHCEHGYQFIGGKSMCPWKCERSEEI